MKKIFFTAAAMLWAVSTFAQPQAKSFSIVPKVGLNVSSLPNDVYDSKSRVGVAAGAEALYQFTDMVGLSAGVLYSQQGGSFTNEDAGKVVITANYVNVPVLANVYVLPGLAVKLGIQPGFRTDATVKMKGEENVEASVPLSTFLSYVSGEEENVEAKDNKIDISLPIGVSYEYKNVVLDARYNFGLNSMFELDGKFKNSVFQFTLGYRFNL